MKHLKIRHIAFLVVLLAGVLLCSPPASAAEATATEVSKTAPAAETAKAAPQERKAFDILMPINYVFYWVNDPLKRFVFVPIATGWNYVIPRPIRLGLNNFQNNILTPFKALNNLLQGKGKRCGTEFARFGINTTIGVLGLFEVAEPKFGLEPHPEDLGQTLGYWGLHEGPYLCLPLIGPTTLRDLPFTLTMTRKAEEWNRGKAMGPILYASGLSIFTLNGQALTYKNYGLSREAAKKAGVSHYKFIRDAYINARYRATEYDE